MIVKCLLNRAKNRRSIFYLMGLYRFNVDELKAISQCQIEILTEKVNELI